MRATEVAPVTAVLAISYDGADPPCIIGTPTPPGLRMHPLIPILVLILVPLYLYWYFARTKAMVEGWAVANRMRILESRRLWFPPLGMFLTTSKSQTMGQIKVSDETTHRIRSGWLRLGSYWWV